MTQEHNKDTVTRRILIVTGIFIVAFAFGRWSSPEKVKIEKEIVEVEKKTSNSSGSKEKHKETETHIIEYPDGRKETIITTHEDWKKNHSNSSSSDSSKSDKESKEIVNSRSKVTVSALGGVNLSTPSAPLWGAAISKPILGPITVGAWGLSNQTFGASLGLTF